MSDESFFREVNEEIRQERTRVIWARYGRLFIAGAVLAVVLAAAYVGWREYQSSQANASGDRYLAALDLATAGKPEEAVTAFEALASDGYGTYRDLARMRVATLRQAAGDQAAAVAAFDAIAADGAAPQALRDMASVRAAYILVDTGSLEDVRRRVVQLSGDNQPLRYAAREALGLSAWKAGELGEAKTFFEQLRDDQGTSSGIGLRTRVMLDLIAAGSSPVSAAAAAPTMLPPPELSSPLDLSTLPGQPNAPDAAPEPAPGAPDAAPSPDPAAAMPATAPAPEAYAAPAPAPAAPTSTPSPAPTLPAPAAPSN